MLEYEVAAIYYFVGSVLKLKPYFDKVPKDMVIPCVFYPTPEMDVEGFSLSSYATNFTIYVKIIDISTLGAANKASQILQAIAKNRNKVPLVDENGIRTGKNFRIIKAAASKVDECVYELEITWKRYTSYTEKAVTLAQEFFFNGVPVGSDE